MKRSSEFRLVEKEKTMLHMMTLVLMVALCFPVSAFSAEKHGGDIWFKDTKKFPNVLFSHDKHIEAGNQCTDCHDKIFKKKKGSTDAEKALKMRNLKKEKYCGACHNGEKAFSVKTACKKCHSKSKD